MAHANAGVGAARTLSAVLVLALVLLAGCSGGGKPATAGAYACERCLWVADDAPERSHFETYLAAGPSDDQHLVAASSWFDGQRFQVSAHTSFDQGRTWAYAPLPYGDRVPPTHPLATINFAGDPGVAIGPDGHTVVVSLVGLTTVPAEALSGNVPLQSTMFLARSDDGGLTFPPEGVTVLQTSAQAYPAVQDFTDHPRIVVGPDGEFLVMWGSLDLPDPTRATRFVQTQDVVLATSLEVRFSMSTDGGRTWSAPALAYKDTDFHYYPPSPVILPDGRWMVMPNEYNGGDGDVFLSLSSDHGSTWSWEPTPMKASGFGTPAVAPDGRIAYSYNALAPSATPPSVLPVLPMLAVADGPGQPWTVHALTDGPMAERMGIENMVAIDGRGAIHVLYLWAPDASAGELRVATLDDGVLTQATVEAGLGPDRAFGHYVGFAGTQGGVVGVWDRADAVPGQIWQPGGTLVGATLEWQD